MFLRLACTKAHVEPALQAMHLRIRGQNRFVVEIYDRSRKGLQAVSGKEDQLGPAAQEERTSGTEPRGRGLAGMQAGSMEKCRGVWCRQLRDVNWIETTGSTDDSAGQMSRVG